MSLNIQTGTGLLEIGGSVTKEKVISALGYEPANKTHVEDTDVHVSTEDRQKWNNKSDFSGAYADLIDAPSITENDSGSMVIADESGNIIMQVDADGLETTTVTAKNIVADGKDVIEVIDNHIADKTAHITEAERTTWNNKSDFSGFYADLPDAPSIQENNSGEVVYADENGNVIAKINADGFETTTVTAKNAVIGGVDIGVKLDEHKESIDDVSGALATHTADTDIHITDTEREGWNTAIDQNTEDIGELSNALSTHTSNTTAHITADERTLWNNKSDFSGDYNDLTNAPDIKEDSSGEVVYADESGNVIAKIGSEGFETTQVIAGAVVVNGTDVGTHIADKDIHITATERATWNNKVDATYVDTAVANLVNSAPDKLNTLDELAAALGDDANFAATVTAQIGLKSDKSYVDEQLATKANANHTHDEYLVADDIANKADKTELHSHSNKAVLDGITSDKITAWNNKSDFSGDYNDLENAPNIYEDGTQSVIFADESGNIILKVDGDGFETTSVIAQSMVVNGTDVEAELAGKSDSGHKHKVADISDLTATAKELNYVDGVTSNIQTQLDTKVASSALSNYYTKTEINNLVLITVDDIDAICGVN